MGTTLSSSAYCIYPVSLNGHHHHKEGKPQPENKDDSAPSEFQLRAKELLDFANGLPEQVIDY